MKLFLYILCLLFAFSTNFPLPLIAGENIHKSVWLVPKSVSGHYHEDAALAQVSITADSKNEYVIQILAKQAHFKFELELDSQGRPSVIRDCYIEKINALGQRQHDVNWTVSRPIEFSCKESDESEICFGKYFLEWRYTNGMNSGQEMRTMKLVRHK